MEELLGKNVKITMNSNSGMILISGEIIKMDENFLVLMTSQGKVFVSLYSIKTIKLSE